MTFHIETERLLLRDLRMEDGPGMFELSSDPLVLKYLGEQPLTSVQHAEEIIADIQQQYTDHGIGRWAAIEKSTGNFIGWSGLKFITDVENNRSHFHDVGFRLMPRYWGKGYATESGRAAIQYGFREMQLQEIIGMCFTENLASRRSLEKCGLTFRENFQWNKIECDWLSVSKEEWQINFMHLQ
jgi:[ribosomal protein S5]-alanine N-acetyltransferase